MNMHDFVQGSDAWHQHRARSLNASELAVAMGLPGYISRNQLIEQKATGVVPEVDEHTQRRFDAGHQIEDAARAIAEEMLGEELYPAVLSGETDGLNLSASLDGLTMCRTIAWECKTLNADLRASLESGQIPERYHPQLEQGLMLSGARKCLFMASDGTPENTLNAWYVSRPELRAQIIPAWRQFVADVAAYVPSAKPEPVMAAPVEALPAVRVQVSGQLAVLSNLPEWGAALREFIARIPEVPATDEDFAYTDKACKALKQAEERLDAAEDSALAQMADVETMRRLVAELKNLARTTRLHREKLVTARKAAIKAEIIEAGKQAFARHLRELNAAMLSDYMPQIPADFAGAASGLKTIDSLRNAVDTELARAKIAANEVATKIQANLQTIKASGLELYDTAALVLKAPDDLAAIIAQRQAAEKAKQEAQRERIRAEEAARLEREAAQAKARAEAEAQRERERIIAQAEAEARAAAAAERARIDAEIAQAEAQITRERFAAQAAEAAAALARAEAAYTPPKAPPAPVVAAPTTPGPADDGERLTLGAINARLAPISVTVAGLSQLGVEPVAMDKAARLYRACDFPAICRAISEHALSAATKKATP